MESILRNQFQFKAFSVKLSQLSQSKEPLTFGLVMNIAASLPSLKSKADPSFYHSVFRGSRHCHMRINAKHSSEEAPGPVPSAGERSNPSSTLSVVNAMQRPGPSGTAAKILRWLTLIAASVIILRLSFSLPNKVRQIKAQNLFAVLDQFYPAKRKNMTQKLFKLLAKDNRFYPKEVVMLYFFHLLETRTFDAELVEDLVHFRRVSGLDDATILEILCAISQRIVRTEGHVVTNNTGSRKHELEKNASVQAAFSKILYLAELHRFWFVDNKFPEIIMSLFEVTERDAENLRIDSL
ncbi:hypothetical protein MPTK1_7g18760 [Marchantia polymorpha subsp. ruderalis]|uniref:Armadillo-like repeats domain-containing protein n=2 Tax=Marchantia polymorpha TaxID=3197 RepID=A0AAF6C171_MARPO|nr:hypothetical protein MARPO_0067s0101 [Marchantia polymorpha]BBN18005.1 hypothetical protein Mp_7g18760 [Marchantia polymorpha subsp. ruderalis]|eukprot:PTQ36030.1 hypothetical protein MARPO_0067s0101 [Marchantia polymorpha]